MDRLSIFLTLIDGAMITGGLVAVVLSLGWYSGSSSICLAEPLRDLERVAPLPIQDSQVEGFVIH